MTMIPRYGDIGTDRVCAKYTLKLRPHPTPGRSLASSCDIFCALTTASGAPDEPRDAAKGAGEMDEPRGESEGMWSRRRNASLEASLEKEVSQNDPSTTRNQNTPLDRPLQPIASGYHRFSSVA